MLLFRFPPAKNGHRLGLTRKRDTFEVFDSFGNTPRSLPEDLGTRDVGQNHQPEDLARKSGHELIRNHERPRGEDASRGRRVMPRLPFRRCSAGEFREILGQLGEELRVDPLGLAILGTPCVCVGTLSPHTHTRRQHDPNPHDNDSTRRCYHYHAVLLLVPWPCQAPWRLLLPWPCRAPSFLGLLLLLLLALLGDAGRVLPRDLPRLRGRVLASDPPGDVPVPFLARDPPGHELLGFPLPLGEGTVASAFRRAPWRPVRNRQDADHPPRARPVPRDPRPGGPALAPPSETGRAAQPVACLVASAAERAVVLAATGLARSPGRHGRREVADFPGDSKEDHGSVAAGLVVPRLASQPRPRHASPRCLVACPSRGLLPVARDNARAEPEPQD